MLKKICCLLVAAIAVHPAVAGTLEDFTGTSIPLQLNDAVKRHQSIELTPAPDGTKAASLSWGADRFRYAEPLFKRCPVLPEFEQAILTVKVYAPENCPVSRFNLRLIDAHGEVFQWDHAVSWRQAGWQTLTYPITPVNFKVSWGGKNDKKLDQPVKLFGFGIDFKKNSGAGKLWIGPVSVTAAAGQKANSTEKLCKFNEDEKWSATFYNGTGKMTTSRTGMTIVGNAGVCLLRDRMFDLISYPAKPSAAIIDARRQNGDATLQLVFRDYRNQTMKSPELQLSDRQEPHRLDLTDTLRDAVLPIRLESCLINSGSKKLALELSGASLIFHRSLIEAVKTDVLTGNPIHVLKVGEENRFALRFTNTADAPVEFRAQAVFSDFFGRSYTQSKILRLPAHGRVDWKPERLPDHVGYWKVSYALSDLATPDSVAGGILSFVYMKPTGPTPLPATGFLFSICTHTERWGKLDQQKEIMAAAWCGAKVIRTGPGWGTLQPSADRWNWHPLDSLVERYGKSGMELELILAFTPQWAATPENRRQDWRIWSRSAPDLKAWQTFASELAKRYRGKIRFYEVWNEPDLAGFGRFSAEEYIRMQQVAYKKIKAADPKATVLSGGFATMSDHPSRVDKQFQEKFLRQAKGSFDVHAYHEHCDFTNYADRVDNRFFPLRQATGTTVPWYPNETAISSMDGAEAFQAETLYKKLLFAWSRGAIGYTWYDLRNDGFDPKEGEHNFGLLTNDFYPKPVYAVYNALVSWFRGTTFVRQLDLGPNLWAFVFKNADRLILPCWNDASGAATSHIIVKTDAKKAEHVDIMGNPTTIPLLNGMTILELGVMPSALNLSGATRAEASGPLVKVTSSGIAVPGHPFRLTLQVNNPLPQQHECRLKLELPAGITAKKDSAAVTIPAGGSVQSGFGLELAADLKGQYGSVPKAILHYQYQGTPWQGKIVIPLNLAISIAADGFERRPDFVLNTREQVVSLCAADPAKSHLVWRDAADLSAKIWLGRNKQYLRLKAIVTDDVHCQPESGSGVWKGDNIQFALNVPGQVGTWEIGLSRLDRGSSEAFIWNAPQGFDAGKAMRTIKLKTARLGKDTVYEADIPLASLGLNSARLSQGIRFNLLVNDNDGELREGWIHIAPNLGTNKNPASYPFIIFE